MNRTKVTYMDVDSLIPYANNPRLNDNAVDAVAASIKEFGFKVPIVVDSENVIINGHTRLKAAHKLGLTQVPVIVADDLTPEQVKAFRLADNKTSELAEWDLGKLDIELGQIPDIDMGALGFELDTGGDWFSRDEREYDEHEEGNDEYNDFVDKPFLTNMETGIVVRTLPKLNEALNAANEENLAKIRRHNPKYSYPSEVITAAMVSRWSGLGVDFSVRADECMKISALDAQKEEGSGIYGGGYLLSEAAA